MKKKQNMAMQIAIMEKRIKALEEALLDISAHQTNAGHHNSRIRMICEEFFSPEQLATWPGRHPMMPEDFLKMLNTAVRSRKRKSRNKKGPSS